MSNNYDLEVIKALEKSGRIILRMIEREWELQKEVNHLGRWEFEVQLHIKYAKEHIKEIEKLIQKEIKL